MRLTAFSDYTFRVLMYLALEPDRLATITEMAAAYGISENHLMKVVHHLGRTGIVEPVRGKGGGVRLAADARDIRVGAVLRASEGETALVECLSADHAACRIAPACRLSDILSEAFEALYESLDTYTLADLLQDDKGLRRRLAMRRQSPIRHGTA